MATYNTNQKKELLQFLEQHKDQAFTIDEMMAGMDRDPAFLVKPGKSTLYRLLPALTEAGTVHRFTRESDRKTIYQIVGGQGCHGHMHMKCNGCGKVLHMSDGASRELMAQIEQLNQFRLDLSHTLLYGTCGTCAARVSGENTMGGLAHE